MLELSFSYAEQNDNKVVTFADDVGTYHDPDNLTGWGAPNVAPTDIDGTTHTLTLDITITEPGTTAVVYDQIDLYANFNPNGGFADTSDLVFPIDATHLLVSGVALGTAIDELPDGIWDVIYTVDEGLAAENAHTEKILIYGKVKVKVYDLLRAISVVYNCDECKTREIMEANFAGAYLSSIEAGAATETLLTAKSEEVLAMLETLEDITINGSNIVW